MKTKKTVFNCTYCQKEFPRSYHGGLELCKKHYRRALRKYNRNTINLVPAIHIPVGLGKSIGFYSPPPKPIYIHVHQGLNEDEVL